MNGGKNICTANRAVSFLNDLYFKYSKLGI